MSGIRGRNTSPEMLLRRGLHGRGYRYRLHDRSIPGTPDLVFRRRRAVIFANGCFWHGHACHLFRWPGTRPDFWRSKIGGNIARDHRVREALAKAGWRVCDVWECQLVGRERKPAEAVIDACAGFLDSDEPRVSIGIDKRVEA